MKDVKGFIKQKKFKVIVGSVCLLLGGVTTQQSIAGIISTILYLIGISLAINLTMEYKEYKKDKLN